MTALTNEPVRLRHTGTGLPRLLAVTATLAACAPRAITFETATVWIRQGTDSARVVVEVASSQAQHEVGLAERSSLDPESGMLFLFDQPRSADEGFWMWRTRVPLDIAFIDGQGVIREILQMEPCHTSSRDDCPGYFSEVPYQAALEIGRGWFERNAIQVGASLRVEGANAQSPSQ